MMKSMNRSPRRAFLGGASVLIGLPFLEALTPRHALGQAGSAPKRFVGYFLPNGFDMADWRPEGTGKDFALGPMMQPGTPEIGGGPGLEVLRDHLLVISGLQNTYQDSSSGDHAGGVGSFMTNRTVPKAVGGTMGGPSIDYLISQHLGGATRRPYFVLGGEPPFWQGGTCDSGYPCAVANHITYDMEGRNLPRVENPGDAFDQLFGGFDPSESQSEAARRWAHQSSILDLVLEQQEGLMRRVSYQDRPRLDEYFTSIREVEKRISNLAQNGGGCEIPERHAAFDTQTEGYYYGASILGNHQEAIEISHELIALGLQCDSTRVVSFMWGNMTSARNYSFIGASGGHHDISHHGGNPTSLAALKRIGRWEYNRFAELLLRLRDMPDVDGRTVLDNTLVFQSSDVSDGDLHNHDDMAVVLAGGAAGFEMGRHLVYDGNWFGELFVSIGQAFGLDITTFGEHGTGPLPGLEV